MQIDIVWNETTTQVDLVDGVATVGGNPKDGIFIEGLPHGLLSLTLDGATLSVTAQRSVRIGNALFPARIPRLVVEGEELKLPNDVVLRRTPNVKRRESRKTIGTAFVARELLNDGALEVQDTRAATLTCVTGLDRGTVFPVPFDDNTIGRGDDAPIRIRDRAVSRSHARLFRTSRTWFIEPVTSSMNGAYVNGLLLKKSKALRTGDTIELGHTVLRFDEPERAPEECTKVERKDPMPLPMAAEPSVKLEAPVEVTTPLAMAPKQPLVSLELMLMSAGAALAVLGMGAVALVFH
jgi:hypothetical protein